MALAMSVSKGSESAFARALKAKDLACIPHRERISAPGTREIIFRLLEFMFARSSPTLVLLTVTVEVAMLRGFREA